MDYDLYYTMLFTEQGMGNLVSITKKGKSAVQFTALIDFGSARSSLTDETIDFMTNYINAGRTGGKPGPDLDLVVVSHQDNDHWSLFPALIKRYAKHPLTIGRLVYGGDIATYTAGAAKVIGQLQGLLVVGADTSILPTTECSVFSKYTRKKPLGPLAVFPATSPVFQFLPVIANVQTPYAAGDIQNNTVSLMVGVGWVGGPGAILLPGDLTSCTIRGFYNISTAASVLKKTFVLSVPHHGSHRTLSDNYQSDPSKRKFAWADWFADFVKPLVLGISAGFTEHRHPYDSVIKLFSDNLGKIKSHPYVSYFPAPNQYRKILSSKAIYTNYSDVPDLEILHDDEASKADKNDAIEGLSKRVVFQIGKDGTVTISNLAPNAAPMPGIVAAVEHRAVQ